MRGNHDQWGEKNHSWKGDNAKYSTIHDWIRKYKPKPDRCEKCGEKRHLECANVSGKYHRDVNDFLYVCVPCHYKMDPQKGFIGRKHSDESKTKMSARKIGTKESEEHRSKISESIKKLWAQGKYIDRK